MAWDDGLEGAHREIAACIDSPLRVIAGPGTGKTFAMMRAVARLLESGAIPERILGVSFTRTAARDLASKVQRLKAPGSDRVEARTLHSWCLRLLRKCGALHCRREDPRPLMPFEERALVCDLQREFGGKTNVKDLLAAFSAYWARLQSQQPGWPTDPTQRRFSKRLDAWLRFHDGMLLDELVSLTYDFIVRNPADPRIPAYDHVLVDEYQDLNKADQDLVDLLARGATLMVAGDENQSIYSIRHARPEAIGNFDATHPGTVTKPLGECLRCPPNIVQMANSLISRNRPTKTPSLLAGSGKPADVVVVQHDSVADEVGALCSLVCRYLAQEPYKPARRVLVLTTRRTIGRAIRERLNELAPATGVRWRARSFFFDECLNSEAARLGFVGLNLLVNPGDLVAWRVGLGLGDRDNARCRPYAQVRTYCETKGLELVECLDGLCSGAIAIPRADSLIPVYKELRDGVAALAGLSGRDLVDALFPVDSDCSDIRELALEVAEITPEPSALREELHFMITQPEIPSDEEDLVRVMTLHKSKGLTAEVVVVAGCVEEFLPTLRANLKPAARAAAFEEQRRLFYVAVTRATRVLVVSASVRMPSKEAYGMGARRGRRYGKDLLLAASPFITELGPACPRPIKGGQLLEGLGLN